MKIICNACSKKYDPLKTEGICPYCGMHAADAQIAEARANDRVKGGSVTEVLRSYLNEKLRKEKKLSPLRQKKTQLLICLALVGCMVLVGYLGYRKYQERLDYYVAQRTTNDISRVGIRMGETFVLAGEDGRSEFRFLSSRCASEYQSLVEGDFKLIELEYEDSGSVYSQRMSDIYITTASGCTAKILNRYTVMDIVGLTEEEFRSGEYEDGLFTAGKNQPAKHKVLFALPKDDKECTVCVLSSNDIYARDKTTDVKYELGLGEGDLK